MSLMEKYNLGQECRRFAYLKEFFASQKVQPRPAVWRLLHFLAFEITDPTEPDEATGGARCFGFDTRLDARTKIELRRVYEQLLASESPLSIEQARNNKCLLEYVQRFLATGTSQYIDAGVKQALPRLQCMHFLAISYRIYPR
ncbi:hypothetical protein FB567DRAFT_529973 [Paraphoma chrysanthemicola]|uniref:Uncharacterized protein n=1 Tax=Paraphoma chrysanthemicola TaxID=798071 RepID=A0A8K0R4D8_9PLEO|nr:hypothetical protein FB567DRAFT_529973 [Paraphoma chrysanthemicola]